MNAPRLNLDWITDDLAVGGELPATAYPRLARDHGLAAVIDMRSEASDDAAALQRCGVELLNLPVDDHAPVSAAQLDAAAAFAGRHLDRSGRVLIHCREGVGRAPITALAVLAARGMDPLDALTLAKDRRWQVSPNPAQYEAWAAWLRARLPAASVPGFDAFAVIAYRHLATA